MGLFRHDKWKTRLEELDEKVTKLQLQVRAMELEWENTYDKMRSMMARQAKRAERMHAEAEEAGALAPIPEALSPQEKVILAHLPPAQRMAQEGILRRRKQQNGGA
jgi:hypothetical protein